MKLFFARRKTRDLLLKEDLLCVPFQCHTLSLQKLILKAKRANQQGYVADFAQKEQRYELFFNIISDVSYKASFHLSTFILALNLFDSVVEKKVFPKELFVKTGMVCLMMASKIRENEDRAMKVKDFDVCFGVETRELIKTMERRIFECLQFRLDPVLPFDFLACLLLSGDVLINPPPKFKDRPILKVKFRGLIRLLMFCAAKEYELNRFSALKVGCSILMLARKMLGFSDIWPEPFWSVSSMVEIDLISSVRYLEHSFNKHQKLEQIKDKGERDFLLKRYILENLIVD